MKHVGVPPRSKQIFFSCGGVEVKAKGYNFGSKSIRWRGGLMIRGGKVVVVVVVVVTTVVWVAGA